MKRYKLVLCSLLSPLAVLQVQAQSASDTTMSRTMLLERDFSPIVQQKNKIDRQPATQEVQQKKNNATLADWQAITVKSAEIGVMPAGQVVAEARDADDGYLEFSAGNFWNADLKAGLKWDEFQIDAKGFFTKGKLDLPHQVTNAAADTLFDQTWQSRYLNGEIKATYKRELANEGLFLTHFGAMGTSVNTFNYQFFGSSIDTLIQVSDKPGRQSWGKVFADVCYESDQFKIGGYYDYSHLSTPDSMRNDWSANTLMLQSAIGWYDQDNWKASIDLDFGGVFGKSKSYVIFHPTFHLSLLPDFTAWRRFYLDLGFGSRREGLTDLMETLPLAYFDYEYKNTIDAMDLHIGYEDNDQGYLRWGIETELGIAKRALCTEAVPVDTTHRDGLYMRVYQDDDVRFGLSAHADYEYSRYFGIQTRAKLLTHSCDAARLSDPTFALDLHLLSHPGRLSLDFGLDMGFGRKYKYLDYNYDLGSDIDICFRGDWHCTKDFALFLCFHDLVGGYGEMYPGVPEQCFNLHAGFSWKF